MRVRSFSAVLAVFAIACGFDETTAAADTDDESGSGTTGSMPAGTSSAMPPGGSGEAEESSAEGESDSDEASSSDGGEVPPGCGDGVIDAGEECDDGNDDAFDGCRPDCTAVELLDPPELEWTYYEIEGTRCLDGSPAGFGVSWNPSSPNVMIYLEGGGACFNDACDFTAFSLPFVPPTDGIFDRGAAVNPVGDWTMIYVPYCSGDIHAGDAQAELGGAMRYFEGYRNITAFLQRWVPSFPGTQTVLLTGISAGGFGAALNATQTADAWGDDVQLVVVDDSGPPLSSNVIPPCLQETFRSTWNLDQTVLAECPACDPNDFANDLFEHVVQTHPNIRFGLFSNMADAIIRTYMGFGWGNGMHDNCEGVPTPVPWPAYESDLVAFRAAHEDHASTFYRHGLAHTALRLGFRTTRAEGTLLADWIAQVIAGERVHVGP